MQTLVNLALVVGGFGTLATVLWAVYTYRGARRMSEADTFRADIIKLINAFEDLMTAFQIYVAVTAKKLFDLTRPDTQAICKRVLSILQETDKAVVEKKLSELDEEISEWVLYSLDAEDLRRATDPQRNCYATMQGIRGYLPVLYEFVASIGGIIFSVYARELHVNTLRDYVKKTVLWLWEMKKDGTTIANECDLVLQWRSLVAISQNQLSGDTSYTDLFNHMGNIVRVYSEGYLGSSNPALAAEHVTETKVDIAMFDGKDYADTMTRIVKWKFGKQDPDRLTELVQMITTLNNKISQPEGEDKEE